MRVIATPHIRLYFNSRPSARGDHISRCRVCAYQISIHAPPRGATKAVCRAESHGRISIHAPPRGATPMLCMIETGKRISIHAPPRGATPANLMPTLSTEFQFTPLREGRRGHQHAGRHHKAISIHAPPRGATLLRDCSAQSDEISIHAPPRGATHLANDLPFVASFQFTPLREGRRQKICNFCKSFVQPLQISMA